MRSDLGIGPVTAQEATGTFGFTAKVDADGIFNPRLKSVSIRSVVPGGPADAAASEMSRLMKKAAVQKLVLKPKRADGEFHAVELAAVARP